MFTMNHLVNALVVLYAAVYCEATLFSKPTGYLPNNRTTELSQYQSQQLDLIDRVAASLPSEDKLQETDFSAALPYVDSISEGSLENFRNTIELTKPKQKSKLLKFIQILKYLKDKKLKSFNLIASLGSKIVHKKKELLGLNAASTTTIQPHRETSAYDPYLAAQTPYSVSYFVPQSPLSAQLPPFYYYPQYPTYPINTQQQNHENTQILPSADQFPPSFPSNTQQKQPAEIPSEFSHLPQLPPLQFRPTYYQLPAQPQYQFQYPVYPINTYLPDTNAVPQSTFHNQSALPVSSAPKLEQSNQQQYSYQTNQIPSFAQPQQTSGLPNQSSNAWNSYPNPSQGSNKFYSTSLNDLAAAGSEIVEKIEEPVKPDSSSKNDSESLKVNNAVASSTSNEISTLKSQRTILKRTSLKPAGGSTTVYPVYPKSLKEDNLKDNDNKSTPL